MLPTADIILPCYNPTGRWVHELLEFYHAVSGEFNLRFIVVNDGSIAGNPDQQVRDLQNQQIPITYFSYPVNKGKGHALRTGVAASDASLIVYTDIDFPFENESVLLVLRKLRDSGADVVAGYRDQSYYSNKMSAFRKILSRSFRWFIRKIVRMPVSDTQCGLKAFNQTGKQVFLSTSIQRYLFDFEFIYLCARNKNIVLQTELVQLKQNVIFSKMPLKVLLQEAKNLLKVLVGL